MPAAVTLWQVRLTTTTGDPADDVVNTYHVQYLNGYDSTKLTATKTALLNFTSNVASIIAPSTVPRDGHRIKAYDLADPKPRAPIYDVAASLVSAGTGEPLPHEVALCVSFKGVVASGEKPSRHRGRIYFGPIADAVNVDGRPSSSSVSSVAAQGLVLLDAIEAIDVTTGPPEVVNTRLGIYSTPDAAFHPFNAGWVDNAFDIQRRRGLAPTTRTTFGPT